MRLRLGDIFRARVKSVVTHDTVLLIGRVHEFATHDT